MKGKLRTLDAGQLKFKRKRKVAIRGMIVSGGCLAALLIWIFYNGYLSL